MTTKTKTRTPDATIRRMLKQNPERSYQDICDTCREKGMSASFGRIDRIREEMGKTAKKSKK